MRNQGAPGAVKSARKYLRDRLDLGAFRGVSARRFSRLLDRHTEALRSALPANARRWGLARKLLNLFLEEAFYNRFLTRRYRLARLARLFEIPLDSQVAQGLREESEGHTLPEWPGVKWLRREQSTRYQEVSADVAARRGLPRVALDLVYWRREVKGGSSR